MKLQDEIDEFHKKIKARALLIAIDWAGSARKLSKMCGLGPDAGIKWLARGQIPPLAALSLSRISGFPLGFAEMSPDVDVRTLARRECPHCWRDINPPATRTGCSPSFNRRSEARARKAADLPVAQEYKIQKQRARSAKHAGRTTGS